jgi:DNA-binding response OmpR family regulator
MVGRQVPLIVIASASTALAESVAGQLRRAGNVVYVAHSADGCLRVAVSVGPDVVLMDPGLANLSRYERLIKAHPRCAHTQVLHLTEALPKAAPPRVPRAPTVIAGPHAA